jgi:phosphatidylglycerophosphatase A
VERSAADVRTFFSLGFATVLGVGYIPIAPGTFGSLAGLALWILLPAAVSAQASTIVFLFVVGSMTGNVAEHYFGRTDPRQVVVDEVLGMMLTLFLNPVGPLGALIGFVFFRAADVIKPYPANRLERLPGGVGVMADDAMAAVYANIALRLFLAFGNRMIL